MRGCKIQAEVGRITEGTQATSAQSAALDAKESLRQPVWHVVVLCILTCFAYIFYWFYKNWRDLQSAASVTSAGPPSVASPESLPAEPPAAAAELERFRDISPPLRTLGLVLPLINFLFGIILPAAFVTGLGLLFSALAIFLAVTLVDGIAAIHPDPNSFPKRHPHVATALVTISLVGSMALTRLPDPYWLLSLAGSVPLAVTQYWLNRYWVSVEPAGLLVRHAFSVKELIAIVIGSLLLGLSCAGMMIGVH